MLSRDPASRIDAQLEVWDLESGKRMARVAPRLGPGRGLSYGFGGGTLAATYDNTLMVHETAQFGTMIHMGGAFESTVGAVIGGVADGLLAVPFIQEIGVRLIHLRSGGEVAYLKLADSPIRSHFSADGSVLLLTHSFGARVVRLKMDQERRVLEGHQGGVPCVEFSRRLRNGSDPRDRAR